MSSKTKSTTAAKKTVAKKQTDDEEVEQAQPAKQQKQPQYLKKDTRIIPLEEFDWSRIVYSEPQKSELPDGSGHFRRVRMQYMYDDHTIGPVIVEFERKYCFGVQPDNVGKDGKIAIDADGKEKALKGYKVPIVMANVKDGRPDPTPREQAEIDFIDAWRSEVIRYAVENKKAIGKGGKDDSHIDGLVGEVLYRKKNEDGEYEENSTPKLYGNIIYYSKSKEVGTTFYGPGDKKMNPLTTTGHFYIYPTVRFDGIFIGGRSISLQHHIYDATVEPVSRAPNKRLARPNTVSEEDAATVEEQVVEVEAPAEDENQMMESEE